MKNGYVPAMILSIIFLAKYIQNLVYGFFVESLNKEIFIISLLLLALAFLLFIFSVIQMRGNFVWVFVTSLIGFALLDTSILIYPNILWIHLYGFSQMFLAIALLAYLYPLYTYATCKFPAFGTAFFIIYVLLEYASLIQNQYNLTVFLTYLTITLIMFIPGLYFLFKEKDSPSTLKETDSGGEATV